MSPQRTSPFIFIAEDEPKIAALLTDYLTAEGYRVQVSADGLETVDSVRRAPPDLLLLDLMLPGKNGLDICREVRSFSQLPIIMVTARVEEIDRLLGLELGADDYICKPFSPREVVARVKALLRRAYDFRMEQEKIPAGQAEEAREARQTPLPATGQEGAIDSAGKQGKGYGGDKREQTHRSAVNPGPEDALKQPATAEHATRTAGQIVQQTAGQAAGQAVNRPTGQAVGQTTGQDVDRAAGQATGQAVGQTTGQDVDRAAGQAVRTANLVVDTESYRAFFQGQALDLTPAEFRLLHLFSRAPGKVFSRDRLLTALYDDHRVVTDRTVDTHIKNLRRKLEQVAPTINCIISIYGIGYRFDP